MPAEQHFHLSTGRRLQTSRDPHILIAGGRLACAANLPDTARPHNPGLSIRFRGAECAVPVEIFLIGGMEIDLELETAGSPCMPPLTPIALVADGLS